MTPSDKQVIGSTIMNVKGRHIRFGGGEYETNDQEEIEFIKGHRLYGSQIIEASGRGKRGGNAEE
jgi:hypothetical protein